MAIISMAQQAKPKVIGQMDDFRAQFTSLSKVVVTTPEPKSAFCSMKGFWTEFASCTMGIIMGIF
jgi:hypothetical protein